jgi:hypothetical protein
MRRAVLVGILWLGLGRPARAADLEAQAAPEQSLAVVGGMVALTLSANAELQTRWGPVFGVGAGGRRLGPSVNAYAGDTLRLGSRWSLRPGFRFARSWLTTTECTTGCRYDFYIGELGFRYRGPTGFLFEAGLPLFGWIPVTEHGDPQPHSKFYTLATGELAFVSTVMVGFTFDL